MPPPDAPRGTLQWRARADTRCRVSQRLARMDACATPLSDETSTTKRRQRNTTYKTVGDEHVAMRETTEKIRPLRLAVMAEIRSSPQSAVVKRSSTTLQGLSMPCQRHGLLWGRAMPYIQFPNRCRVGAL